MHPPVAPARVLDRYRLPDDSIVLRDRPRQHSAALKRIRRFTMLAEPVVCVLGDREHPANPKLNCSEESACARVEAIGFAADTYFNTLLRVPLNQAEPMTGDWIASMAGKSKAPTLGQIRDALRAHSFEVTEVTKVSEALRVAKYGCAAVLVPSGAVGQELGTSTGVDTVVAYKERPGALVAGEIARLLDRGYQKFLKTSKYELPATAAQLQAIHQFTEELTQVTGGVSLYNEALGTTSDLYHYDRVKGREAQQPAPARPWELTPGH